MTKVVDTIFILVMIAFSVASYFVGYEQAEQKITAEYQHKFIEQQTQQAKEYGRLQSRLLEVEKDYLAIDPEIKTVYQDRVKTVTKKVTEHVESNDLADCRLDDDSLQQLNQALSGTN